KTVRRTGRPKVTIDTRKKAATDRLDRFPNRRSGVLPINRRSGSYFVKFGVKLALDKDWRPFPLIILDINTRMVEAHVGSLRTAVVFCPCQTCSASTQ